MIDRFFDFLDAVDRAIAWLDSHPAVVLAMALLVFAVMCGALAWWATVQQVTP